MSSFGPGFCGALYQGDRCKSLYQGHRCGAQYQGFLWNSVYHINNYHEPPPISTSLLPDHMLGKNTHPIAP